MPFASKIFAQLLSAGVEYRMRCGLDRFGLKSNASGYFVGPKNRHQTFIASHEAEFPDRCFQSSQVHEFAIPLHKTISKRRMPEPQSQPITVSAVIPVYNEVDSIRPLANELLAVSELTEILFVNDGSADGTTAALDQLATQHPRIRVHHQPQNAGQSAAMWTGFQQAAGEIIVCLDGDGQNDPADIPLMLAALSSSVDVVCGRRAKRRDSWSKRTGSRWANRVRNWVTHDGVADTGCSLKAFRRACVPDLPPLDGMHRFMPAYFTLKKRRIVQIDVNHRAREHGQSKYTNLSRLPRTLLDLFGFWWFRRRSF